MGATALFKIYFVIFLFLHRRWIFPAIENVCNIYYCAGDSVNNFVFIMASQYIPVLFS